MPVLNTACIWCAVASQVHGGCPWKASFPKPCENSHILSKRKAPQFLQTAALKNHLSLFQRNLKKFHIHLYFFFYIPRHVSCAYLISKHRKTRFILYASKIYLDADKGTQVLRGKGWLCNLRNHNHIRETCGLVHFFPFRRFSRISWSRLASRSSSFRFFSANSCMIVSWYCDISRSRARSCAFHR